MLTYCQHLHSHPILHQKHKAKSPVRQVGTLELEKDSKWERRKKEIHRRGKGGGKDGLFLFSPLLWRGEKV